MKSAVIVILGTIFGTLAVDVLVVLILGLRGRTPGAHYMLMVSVPIAFITFVVLTIRQVSKRA